jgi:hypothetical protein
MAAPELTPELQNELDILKMRSAIDPSRFYKKSDATAQSKYFQVNFCILFTRQGTKTLILLFRLVMSSMPQQIIIPTGLPKKIGNVLLWMNSWPMLNSRSTARRSTWR